MKAYTLSVEKVLETLGVRRDVGLDQEQIKASREEHGENAFRRDKQLSLPRRILEAASEPMIVMLLFAVLITVGVNVARYYSGGETDFIECVGIFAAILLSVMITVAMEGRSAKAFEELSKLNEDTFVKVTRGGKTQLIPQRDIVIGDILYVETGDKLPADGRLLDTNSLQADESALTGESLPVQKEAQVVITNEKTPVAERVNMLYSGSFITGGNGVMAVTGVGDSTEFGKIAKELSSTEKSSTPLQEKMAQLGKRIAILGSAAAAIMFVVQLFIFFRAGTAGVDTIYEAFITSIILIVAAVPEGLPTITAVSLSINIIKMSKQNALVKKMIACETVGCINIICTDKTGTITENRMTVTDIFSEKGLIKPEDLQQDKLLQNFCVNGTADVHFEEEQPKFIGNPTECALLVAANKAGVDYREQRSQADVIHVYPFSSEEKDMTTILKKGDKYIAYTKGSPEKIISLCAMDDDLNRRAEAEIMRFQEKASRVIGFAHKEFEPLADLDEKRKGVKSNMVFDGFVAITDPLRHDVYEAVQHCRQAGIDIKMLTGDNIVTATAIANELSMLEGGKVAVEAKELESMSDEELSQKIDSISVIARSTPGIKMRVVKLLKADGNVVAVTGDGINDAPALKNADVGIAMGISGTEVSKAASDIVLLDDSFATITKAVQWGRGIYENFQRFIQFQLTVNLSAVTVILAAILLGFSSPFTALQLLWINIIMDGPPALTLGLEPIREDLMKRRPIRRDASIVSGNMLWRIVANGVFISLLMMMQLLFNFLNGTPEQTSTILFTLFVLIQLFNAFNCRELSNRSILNNISGNKLMVAVFAATLGIQAIITQFGGVVFDTVALPLDMWLKMIAVAASVIIVSELIKAVQRMLNRPQSETKTNLEPVRKLS